MGALASRLLRQMNAKGGGGLWRIYGAAALILLLVVAALVEWRKPVKAAVTEETEPEGPGS